MRPSSLATILAAVVLVASPLRAATGGFSSTLSGEQQVATGIANLDDSQREALNDMVAAEVALARKGDTKGFSGTFSSRRTPEELSAAGLDRLSKEQLAEVDHLVEALIASGPVARHFSRQLTKEEVSTTRKRLEVHGALSYTIGGGSGGRSFQGGSISTVILDRETGTTLAFSYGQYDGDLPEYFGGGYYYGGPVGFPYLGARGFSHGGFCGRD